MIEKRVFIIITLLLLASGDLFCQADSSMNCNEKIEGIYGLHDFVKYDPNLPVNINSLIVHFDSQNQISYKGGNGGNGKYTLCKNGCFKIDSAMTTLAYLSCETKRGFKFELDLFIDTLFRSNRIVQRSNELKFFRDDKYLFTLKPYYALLDFRNKENEKGMISEIKIDSASNKEERVLINSQEEKDSLSIYFHSSQVDYSKSSILIIRNKSLDEVKKKELRKYSHKSWKLPKDHIYPTSYAKLYENKKNRTTIDIVNTFYRSYGFERRRGKFSGFIIPKTNNIEDLDIYINYTE